MERLFILRHGDYGLDGNLSEIGKIETKKISELIKKDIVDKDICILSSIAKRAIQTSNIIAKELNIDKKNIFKINVLFSERHSCSIGEIRQINQSIDKYLRDYKTVIIISHYQLVNGLFTHYLNEISSEELSLDKPKTSEGYYIDFINKTYKKVVISNG
jgi:phosphohistidine phosphatase SixA